MMEIKQIMVSVIMPVYNTEEFVENAIISVLNQTYKNFELIIVNDGSTDGSADICKKYRDRDERIVYIDSPNRGVSHARNTGVSKSTGKWISFIDSDDLWNDTILQVMVDKANSIPEGKFFYCGYKEVNTHNQTLNVSIGNIVGKFDSFIHKSGEWRIPFHIDSILVERDFIIKYQITFDEGYAISEDIGFFLKILCVTLAYPIPQALASYVRHDDSATTKEWDPYVWKSTIQIFDSAESYCKRYCSELYDKLLLIKSFRVCRYIVSLVKNNNLNNARECIREYKKELEWGAEKIPAFRDRLRCKVFLSEMNWAICMACL